MLKLTTDKHEASRGLSATAELLVIRGTGREQCVAGVRQLAKFTADLCCRGHGRRAG